MRKIVKTTLLTNFDVRHGKTEIKSQKIFSFSEEQGYNLLWERRMARANKMGFIPGNATNTGHSSYFFLVC